MLGILLIFYALFQNEYCFSYSSDLNKVNPKIYTFEVLEEYPHVHLPTESEKNVNEDKSYELNRAPFTQGILFLNSTTIMESAGLYEGSFIRMLEYPSMKKIYHHVLHPNFWGEGIAIYNDILYQLTWTSGIVIAYSLKDMSNVKYYSIQVPGWGLTSDLNSKVWATTGSDELLELDIPEFDSKSAMINIKKRIKLSCLGKPLYFVNEMEYVPKTKTIWGNIFQSSLIVEINPETGNCVSIADLSSLYSPKNSKLFYHVDIANDVLNGIAYHPSFENLNKDKSYENYKPILLVTGKRWPRMYLIKLNEILMEMKDTDPNFDNLEDYFSYYLKNNKQNNLYS